MSLLDEDDPTLIYEGVGALDAPTQAPPPAYPARYLPSPRPRLPLRSLERAEPAPEPLPAVTRDSRPTHTGQRALKTLLVAALAALVGASFGSAFTRSSTAPLAAPAQEVSSEARPAGQRRARPGQHKRPARARTKGARAVASTGPQAPAGD